ncbi:MAG TPA: murein L,D-transpeptidase catalytic domain family protein [Bacteroidales bacterium]|nr:murein L,D-transpeptidase catalytic domain family protein [Bacteroidales bacterium]HPT10992.1 murein L,D-transpeptidase catalytic domain family protein [Bacteroidales bacterium]
MSYIILLAQLLVFGSLNHSENYLYPGIDYTKQLYYECGLEPVLSYDVFKLAITGMARIDNLKNKGIITIVDFSKPSTRERLYVIDLEHKKILYKSLVAHGKNSGGNMATSFSNNPRSLKSCLGFFITAETYNGKYGYSLRLDGLEPGFNDNARRRSIVVHGADFVSFEVANDCGLLGRSYGCPALPENKTKPIIDRISRGSCLFIYGKDPKYLKNSKILNEQLRLPVTVINTQKGATVAPRLGS